MAKKFLMITDEEGNILFRVRGSGLGATTRGGRVSVRKGAKDTRTSGMTFISFSDNTESLSITVSGSTDEFTGRDEELDPPLAAEGGTE